MKARTHIAALTALLLATALPAAGGEVKPVVVELFTSQGCSSCPPADEFFNELAGREDVVALTLSVDIWDYLGWRDTLAKRAHSLRQQAYAQRLPSHQVFTPQAVIDGVVDAVGSHRSEIERLIDERAALGGERVPVSIEIEGDAVKVTIAADPAHGQRDATVWFIRKLSHWDVSVGDGENRGRVVRYSNVVRDMSAIGMWTGERTDFSVPRRVELGEIYDGFAVIVQEDGEGEILGAAALTDPAAMSIAGGE